MNFFFVSPFLVIIFLCDLLPWKQCEVEEQWTRKQDSVSPKLHGSD